MFSLYSFSFLFIFFCLAPNICSLPANKASYCFFNLCNASRLEEIFSVKLPSLWDSLAISLILLFMSTTSCNWSEFRSNNLFKLLASARAKFSNKSFLVFIRSSNSLPVAFCIASWVLINLVTHPWFCSTSLFILNSFLKIFITLPPVVGPMIAVTLTAVFNTKSKSTPSNKSLSSFKTTTSKALWPIWVKTSSITSIGIPL